MPRTIDQWRVLLDAETDRTSGCWLWTGKRNEGGYGLIKSRMLAHRLAWQVANRQEPGRARVCHTCDNRRCVNPAHLYLGGPKMNTADAMRRGRQTWQDKPASRRLEAIKRRQVRREEWEEAHSIEPSDLLGVATG